MTSQITTEIRKMGFEDKQKNALTAIELQRKSTENRFLVDCIRRFQEIVKTSRIMNDCKTTKLLSENGGHGIERTGACLELWVNKMLVGLVKLRRKKHRCVQENSTRMPQSSILRCYRKKSVS